MNRLFTYIYVWVFYINSFYITTKSEKVDNCVISNNLHTAIDGYYRYPIETVSDKNGNIQVIDNIKNYTLCIASRKFHCSISDNSFQCPISDKNLDDAYQINDWDTKHSLCHLKSNLISNTTKSKFIVFGGSAAVAMNVDECCCNPEISQECPKYHINECLKIPWTNRLNLHPGCAWSYRVYRWLKSLSAHGNIEFHNLAVSGSNTLSSANNFENLWLPLGKLVLNHNDIIFIDHSANDGNTNDPKYAAEIRKAVHKLLQLLIFVSLPESWPTIIILHSYFGVADIYETMYSEAARIYKVPIWSYVNLVDLDINHIHFLNLTTPNRVDHHPNWHIHLFYSDMISALMNREFQFCNTNNSRTREIIDMKIPESERQYLPILCLYDQIFFNFIPTIDLISAHNSFGKAIILSNATIIKIPNHNNTWKLYEDSRGKPGLIDEDNDDTSGLCQNSIYASKLVLSLSKISNMDLNQQLILQISYLETYFNAGMMDIIICNQVFKTMDVLSHNFSTIRVSNMNTVNIQLNKEKMVKHCTDKSDFTIQFSRRCFNSMEFSNVEKDSNITEIAIARHRNKIKISGIKLCQQRL